ncbi:hypothetical protein PTSG_13064 [Salpingoeca rosetta]|uniref:TNFR-Cys domain-containing protein n=1 Tax=Salpingoeca rosetta (strain ATCC 50818 / BSB-021) TaxID=946362 RepID=F2URL5_SALR5|nr:uncharacterized protein PTSG_13064 [Salpingoeca rosetta]EGD80270.1 hypothetical protein PTSG_13064 [Salpingoeca rosetta]|eukprot:XP_004988060.1 hypothetical protein PTSG_13064 [Salpingoeca rosetta]
MAIFLSLLTVASVLLVATGQPSGFHGWANNFGGYLSFTCPSNQVLDGWYGVFSNSRLDRRYSFRCTNVNSITYRSFGGYENSYYGGFTKTYPNGQAIYRIQAGHSDGYRDRRWRIGCADHTNNNGPYHSSCSWSGWTNNWPSYYPYYYWFPFYYYFYYFYSPFYYYHYPTTSFTANSKYVIHGVQSDFSYTFRDRRWRFYQCRVSCRSGWVQSGTECTCPSGSYQRGNDCVSSRKCGRGQYAASSSNNRYCYDCRPGTFQSDSSHTDTTCSSCPAGKFQDDYGRADCETCPSSQYNPYTGRSSCRDCSSGYYRSSPSTQTRCQPGYRCPGSCSRIACSPGTYQNSYRQVSCKSCEAGKYQTESGASSCNNCANGYYTTSAASAPRRCQPGFACSSCNRRACNGEFYQNAAGESDCKRASQCGAGQYVSRGPSQTTDRVCGSCSLGRTYQDASSHTFGSCKPVRNCPAGTFVAADPTLSSDRVCGKCQEGTYSSGVNAKQCEDIGTCDAGEYAFFASSTSGVDCRACALGSTYQDETNHNRQSCKTVSPECPAGQFQAVAPTRSNDRVCNDCHPGTFSDRPGGDECDPHTQCGAGFIETSPATPTSDRACRRCNGVTQYQDELHQASCKTVRTCSSTQYETTAPSPSNNRVCASCTTSCPSGKVLVGTCGPTTDKRCESCHPSCATCDGTTENDCLSCADSSLTLLDGRCVNPDCGEGEYRDGATCKPCDSSCAECDGAGSNRCISCKGDRYLDGNSCVTKCPTGYFKFTNSERDNVCRRCTSCDDGTFASTPCDGSTFTDTQCSPWSTCDEGEEEDTPPNSVRDRVCRKCEADKEYQDQPGKLFCKSVSVCQHGQYVSTEPTLTTDRQCSACGTGTFTNSENAARCLPCAAGSFQDETNSPSCQECGIGMYEPEQGQTQCAEIPPGYYGVGGTISTRTGIAECPRGYYCLGGSHDKQACPPNQYQSETGQSQCVDLTVCGDGELVSKEPTSISDRECSPCPDGTYQDDNDHDMTECIPWTTCPVGTHISTTGNARRDQSCASCDAPETFQDKENQRTCRPVSDCPVGTAELVGPTPTSDRKCRACQVGTNYADDTGLEICKPVTNCRPGTREVAAPTASSDRVCQACEPNTYTESENEKTCRPHTLCGASEKEVEEPTTSSNRRCGCTGPAIDECTACGPNLQLRNGRCISECPDGEYELGNGCAECHSTCADCDGPDATNCLLCDGNLNLWVDEQGQSCIADCPPGYYAKDHRCVPCTSCGMGTWASTPCSASSDAVCSPWTECKPGQKDCTLGMEYQPLPGRTSCFPTSVCEEPFIETIPPTLTTDRLCSCDTLTCNKFITQLFEEMVCAEPTDKQFDVVLDVCCSGQGEDGIRDTIRQMDAYEARRSCPGCTDTCECSAGFILVFDADSADCRPCDGVTEFSPSIGGSKCEPIEECERGQEEVSAPTCCSSDRVCRDCLAGTIDKDSAGSTGCQMCPAGHYTEAGFHGSCSSFTCRAGTHDHDSDAATPCQPCVFGITYQDEEGQTTCKDVTECAPGFEEVQAMTLISDRVCDECPEGTYKAISGQGVPCLPVTTCDAGDEETAEPTPTSDRVCSQCELGATFKPVDGQAESCRPVTQCGPDEEEIREPTRQHDRLCRKCVQDITYRPAGSDTCVPVSRCAASEYNSTHATLTTDVECTAVSNSRRPRSTLTASTLECSECPSGRYEIRACSALENVQCAGCSACPPNTYILRACDSENDVSCQQCSTCSDEQYRSAPCTATSDTECTTLDVCDQDQFELFPATPTTDRICRDLSQRNPTTEYERTACATSFPSATLASSASARPPPPPTPSASRAPSAPPTTTATRSPPASRFLCPAGTADLDRNASTPCTPCQAGVDFAALSGQRDCTPVTECDLSCHQGVRPTMHPTIFTDRQCRRCIEGLFYRDSNMDFCTRDTDRECQMGHTCPNNTTFISRPLTPTT